VLIAANQDTVFSRLADVMGRPELADDQRYSTHGARGANAEELDELIAAWTATLTSDEVLDKMHANGIPAGLTYRAKDMLADPHFKAREAIIKLAHPEFGEFPMQNVFPKLSGTPGEVRSVGPELGANNSEIYTGLLGLTAGDLEDLTGKGII